METILAPFLRWGPLVSDMAIFLSAFYFFISTNEGKVRAYRRLLVITAFFYLFYAALKTFVQYVTWLNSDLSSVLLRFPYFVEYSFLRFWLTPVLSLITAYFFYSFLNFLKKHKDRFFDVGETELGFLLALLVGWPNFVVFLPIALLAVVMVSLVRMVFFKKAYTTLGWSLILGTFVTLLKGGELISLFGLRFLIPAVS